jgi:hypothetical protein
MTMDAFAILGGADQRDTASADGVGRDDLCLSSGSRNRIRLQASLRAHTPYVMARVSDKIRRDFSPSESDTVI